MFTQERLRSVLEEYAQDPAADMEVLQAWNVVLEALQDGYITSQMVEVSVEGVAKGGVSWDEFGIVPDESDSQRLEVFYGRYSKTVSCNASSFLNLSLRMMKVNQSVQRKIVKK